MTITTAADLYFDNGTVVDNTGSPTVDIRFLNSTQPAADTSTQVNWTHTQDNNGRVFRPGVGNNAAVNVGTAPNYGYALRLTQDMTPTDDTNCNACLTAGTYTIGFKATLNQSGGTYVSGTYGPTFYVALWRYNPTTNSGTLIGSNGSASVTWNYTPATGDLGTQKDISINVTVSSLVEFAQGEILMIELGLNVGTCPDPTIGTATWTCNLGIGYTNAKVHFDAGEGIRTLCATQGTSTGLGTASGISGKVLPQVATSAGVATAPGVLGAIAQTIGSAAGVGAAPGVLAAVKGTVGSASGVATAPANMAAVKGMVGTVTIGAGGGTTINIRPTILFDD